MNNNKAHTSTSSIQGTGVLISQDIQKGEIILAIDDTRIVDENHPIDPSKGEKELHCDWLGKTVVLMQKPERYINHSCDPNTFVKTINKIRYVLALEDIKKDEEITYDYCINGYGETVWQCNCGSKRCRKTIHSDFFHLPISLQIEYLPLLDSWYCEEYKEKVQNLIKQEFE